MPASDSQDLPGESNLGHVLNAGMDLAGAGDGLKSDFQIMGDSISDLLAPGAKYDKFKDLIILVTTIFIACFTCCLLICFACGVFETPYAKKRKAGKKRLAEKAWCKRWRKEEESEEEPEEEPEPEPALKKDE
jgi:hypothetical protein